MKLIKKQYKADKTIEILKKPRFFIAQQGNLNSQKWINLKHEFKIKNVKICKIHNNLVKKLYTQNTFLNISRVIQGPLIIGYSKHKYDFNNMIELLNNFTVLCLKNGSRFYTPKEVRSAFLNSNGTDIRINFILELIKVSTLISYCLTKKIK
jgi:hypothetical protein